MDIDDEELELCAACGGVVFSPVTAGGSVFIGLWESSEIPPFPFTAGAGGLAEVCAAGLCTPAPCSVDLGDGVAVDIAEMGEEAAELCA